MQLAIVKRSFLILMCGAQLSISAGPMQVVQEIKKDPVLTGIIAAAGCGLLWIGVTRLLEYVKLASRSPEQVLQDSATEYRALAESVAVYRTFIAQHSNIFDSAILLAELKHLIIRQQDAFTWCPYFTFGNVIKHMNYRLDALRYYVEKAIRSINGHPEHGVLTKELQALVIDITDLHEFGEFLLSHIVTWPEYKLERIMSDWYSNQVYGRFIGRK